jgi:hypothetical protein
MLAGTAAMKTVLHVQESARFTTSPVPTSSIPLPTSGRGSSPGEGVSESGIHSKPFFAPATYGALIGGAVVFLLLVFSLVMYEVLKDEPEESAPAQAAAAPVPQRPEADIPWPDLVLTGVLAADPAKGGGSAVINGFIVPLGARIRGAKLISMDDKGVVLEFHGQRREIAVGGTTS